MKYKGKHLTLSDRVVIQLGLKQGLSLNEIAKQLFKDPRTISFEIKRHLLVKENTSAKAFYATDKFLCLKHKRFPYVCDGCQKSKGGCYSDRYYYDAKQADDLYRLTLSSSRNGINLSDKELINLNQTLKYGVKNGQSIEHIVSSNPDLPCSSRSIYRHIENDCLDVKTFHLRNKPKMRKRKTKKPITKSFSHIEGRTFMDYLEFIYNHPGMFTCQLDTVEGLKSDTKCIMTLIIIELHFFYAVVLNKQTANNVIKAFDYIEDLLGINDFKTLYPVILTDRGHEFTNPFRIENSLSGVTRSRLFYCEPLASYQKGAIESIHRLLRYVFPKGKSLDFISQSKLELFISCINSYKLRSNNFHTAYELVLKTFGQHFLDKLKVKAIDPDSIHLTPLLVK